MVTLNTPTGGDRTFEAITALSFPERVPAPDPIYRSAGVLAAPTELFAMIELNRRIGSFAAPLKPTARRCSALRLTNSWR